MALLFNKLLKPLRVPFGGGGFFACLMLSLMGFTATAAELKPIDNQNVVEIGYVPPVAGSYELQRIMTAADGDVLDIEGRRQRLQRYTGGKVTLLSFIYSSCADPSGCPYAYMVFHSLKARLERDAGLHDKVRLVSLSFDPKRDTPQMLKLYAGDNALPNQPVEWDFLTTASLRELLPILDDFGQDVYLELDPVTGQPLGSLSHVLKVFLIDRDHLVREVYTTVYLQADIVYNDILTLLMEQGLPRP
jgi:cytochrome oxidase Cu insertion factor (SCO1/SenC/PrrC family)